MKRHLPLVLLVVLCHFLEAQKFRQYKTLDYMASITQEKQVDTGSSQFEKSLHQSLKFSPLDDYTIPVVFHVLYSDESQRLSKSRIFSQLEILNNDFGLQSPNIDKDGEEMKARKRVKAYYDAAADVRIRFCLAATDPKGNFTEGILYKAASQSFGGNDYNAMKENEYGSEPWDVDRYLNIWVVALEEGNSGYAQMPFGPPSWDGIVIDFKYFGSGEEGQYPYDEGHTLTHLAGNYLGLYPLWGPYPCGDDYVDDTPIHNAPNHRCPDDTHYSLCDGNPVEMTMNFMDNTFDACLSMFTKGQRNRMQKVLHPQGARGGLNTPVTQCQLEWFDPVQELLIAEEEETFNAPAVLSVRPNPAHRRMWIHYNPGDPDFYPEYYQLQVYSITGNLIMNERTGGGLLNRELDVSSWSSGLYLLRLYDGKHVLTHRFIVQE